MELFDNYKSMRLADQFTVFGAAALCLEKACECDSHSDSWNHIREADKVMEGVECPQYWKLRGAVGIYLAWKNA